MKRFLSLFYRRSPLVRVLLVAVFILLLSGLVVAGSLYHLYTSSILLDKELSLDDQEKFAQDVQPHKIEVFLEACNKLGAWVREEKLASSHQETINVASFTPDQARNIDAFLDWTDRLSWHDVLVLATQTIPRTRAIQGASSLVPRLLVRYIGFQMKRAPASMNRDLPSVVGLILKHSVISTYRNRNLLGKLVETTITAALDGELHRLCQDAVISSDMAGKLLEEIEKIDALRLSLSRVSREEDFYHAALLLAPLRKRSPFGYYLVEKVLGDPRSFVLMRVEAFAEAPTDANVAAFKKMPRFFLDHSPPSNYLGFWRECFVTEARRRILKQELAAMAGLKREFKDPYSQKPLLDKEIDGRKIFYGVGPNLRDDGMSGDDIFFKCCVTPCHHVRGRKTAARFSVRLACCRSSSYFKLSGFQRKILLGVGQERRSCAGFRFFSVL